MVIRYFLRLFLPLLIFLSCIIIYFYQQEVKADHATLKSQERYGIDQQRQIIEAYFQVLKSDLTLLSRLHELKLFCNEQESIDLNHKLSQFFFNFIATKGCYDQGCGIDEEDKGRLFDPYFSSRQTFAQKGLGLGLTTAFSIIDKHAGSIQVSSRKGEGTAVEIYLPAVAGESMI